MKEIMIAVSMDYKRIKLENSKRVAELSNQFK